MKKKNCHSWRELLTILHKVKIKITPNTYSVLCLRHWTLTLGNRKITNYLDLLSVLKITVGLGNISSIMLMWMGQKKWRLGRRRKSQNGLVVSTLSFVESPELGCWDKDWWEPQSARNPLQELCLVFCSLLLLLQLTLVLLLALILH